MLVSIWILQLNNKVELIKSGVNKQRNGTNQYHVTKVDVSGLLVITVANGSINAMAVND